MGYDTAHKTDPASVVPEEWGGMWFLKDELETNELGFTILELETNELGFTILELEPDGKGKEHDETATGQEELYYVVSGEIEVDLTDREETVTLAEDDVLRLDPDEPRQIHNRGDERAKLVLVGAPL
ncbi:cupin domain-containing protein [Natrarchaeobaculum sulfurireducens]|uniref:Cupin type-2 domain-containing protein n=1 Tax=Natrarchaeobaculum sulfurireducens TaxID=2044521 RepID=A0A346PUN5_9EURY|nr:cupin domain-containing protein [Natrarchaeobaculum sulfurireducens]AXR83230.1 hypothetical protein AArcMg_3245 [Natrarchaeobaculum sulfurireducens]